MELEKFDNLKLKVMEGKREKEYNIKCKFFDSNGNEYWIYSNDSIDKKGNVELHVSKVVRNDDGLELVSCMETDEIKVAVNMYSALKQNVVVEGLL